MGLVVLEFVQKAQSHELPEGTCDLGFAKAPGGAPGAFWVAGAQGKRDSPWPKGKAPT